MQAKERIILALDVDTEEEALKFVELLYDDVGMFKVGMQLFDSVGPRIVERIRERGGQVFLDLKFHDIPNTVAAASRAAVRTGCRMFNVHAAGGVKMMQAAARAVQEEAEKIGVAPPYAIAVTVLTSLSPKEVSEELRIGMAVDELVTAWAVMAKESGLNGVVASPREITAVRRACGPDFIIVTPGVRPVWAETNDQVRVTTPREAVDRGADFIVVGRPILKDKDPRQAARRIVQELEE